MKEELEYFETKKHYNNENNSLDNDINDNMNMNNIMNRNDN